MSSTARMDIPWWRLTGDAERLERFRNDPHNGGDVGAYYFSIEEIASIVHASFPRPPLRVDKYSRYKIVDVIHARNQLHERYLTFHRGEIVTFDGNRLPGMDPDNIVAVDITRAKQTLMRRYANDILRLDRLKAEELIREGKYELHYLIKRFVDSDSTNSLIERRRFAWCVYHGVLSHEECLEVGRQHLSETSLKRFRVVVNRDLKQVMQRLDRPNCLRMGMAPERLAGVLAQVHAITGLQQQPLHISAKLL